MKRIAMKRWSRGAMERWSDGADDIDVIDDD